MNTQLNLFVPQWQGSGFTDELYHGAYALKKYIEKKCLFFTEVPISLSKDLKQEQNIIGHHTIAMQLDAIAAVVQQHNPAQIFTVGGGCGIEIPLISFLVEKYEHMDIIWLDAHGDLNTPESSPSKYFHGMPLRFLTEEIPGYTISEKFNKISPNDVTLIGVRELDPPEKTFIEKSNLRLLRGNAGAITSRRIKECLQSKNRYAYLHIDLDVLDPEIYRNVKCPTENGLTIEDLLCTIHTIEDEKEIVGMSLLENTETDMKEFAKLDKLIDKRWTLKI